LVTDRYGEIPRWSGSLTSGKLALKSQPLRIDPIRIFFSILFNLRVYRTFSTYATYRKIIVRLFPRFPRGISFVAYLASFLVTSAVSPWNVFRRVPSVVHNYFRGFPVEYLSLRTYFRGFPAGSISSCGSNRYISISGFPV
jgi:hypothetical protein